MPSRYHLMKNARFHPITQEVMYSYAELLQALDDLTHAKNAVILGGDVLDAQGKHLYINWYYEMNQQLSSSENARQSYAATQHFIQQLPLRTQYFYILVLDPAQ